MNLTLNIYFYLESPSSHVFVHEGLFYSGEIKYCESKKGEGEKLAEQ